MSPNPNKDAAEVAGAETGVETTAATAPGLELRQDTHLTSCALFRTKHTSQSQAPSGFLNLSPNPNSPVAVDEAAVVVVVERVDEVSERAGRVSLDFTPVPGLAVSQATHLITSGLLLTKHVSHSQLPAGGAKRELMLAGASAGLLSGLEAESVLGCGAKQATHFLSEDLFCNRQVSQLHEPAGGLNLSPNPEKVADDNEADCEGLSTEF